MHKAASGHWVAWLAVTSACSAPRPGDKADAAYGTAGSISRDTPSLAIDTTPPPGDTALGRCAAALQPASVHQQAVIDAVKAAYALERTLFQRTDSITGRDQVYAHYRQGFSEQLAQQLADYSWSAEDGALRATHAALAIPDTLGILELTDDEALVAWIAPTGFREEWGLPRCLVDRLGRENGRWVVEVREP